MKHALIISQDNIDKIKDILLMFGFAVDVETNFGNIKELLEKNEYKVIFTDAKLQNMVYFEHIKIIKSIKNYSSIPIFILSYEGVVETNQVISAGCNDLILNPFSKEKILNALKKVQWSNNNPQ